MTQNLSDMTNCDAFATTTEYDLVDEAIAEWRREWPDLDFSPIAIIARLVRAYELMRSTLEKTLRPFGLNRSTFDTLTVLRRAGQPYELSASKLAEGCMRPSSTLTTRIVRLEDQGLIMRSVDADDARSSLIRLTDRGVATINEVGPIYLAAEAKLLKHLPPKHADALATLLRSFISSIENSTAE